MAARGDYARARRRIVELRAQAGDELREALDKQARTLEVLESIDVIRRLLREGETAAAARAAASILDALSHDEYARLGVVAAALSLLGRATELARRIEGGDETRQTREEVNAFVDYLGTELNELGRENVDRPLEHALDPEASLEDRYTLGDLLSRRPWKPNIAPAYEGVPESGPADASGRRIAMPVDGSPVIGRILIEQENREKVSTAPQTQAHGDGGDDVFGIIGKAALENWHVVLFSALIFAAFGYLAQAASPVRYQSDALMQKLRTTKLRTPESGETSEYVPSLPSKTVLQIVKQPSFHDRVSRRLENGGWTPEGEAEPKTYAMAPEAVAMGLTVKLTETGNETYLIEFSGENRDPELAQALAGAAAAEFREVHYEHVTSDAKANLEDYERRDARIQSDLEVIYAARLNEFAVDDTESVGVNIQSRTRQLVAAIHSSKEALAEAQIQLRAARDELETQVNIAQRLPEYDQPDTDARIEARRQFLDELERELYQHARKRNSFGPDHPIQEKIQELQDDIELIKAEIRELEKGSPEDLDERKLNPVRALAEDRVAQARTRVSIQHDKVERLEARIPALELELGQLRDEYLESERLRRQEEELLQSQERTKSVIEDLNAVMTSSDRELVLVSPASSARELERETLVGIAVGLVLGLVIGIGIAIGLLRRRRATTATA